MVLTLFSIILLFCMITGDLVFYKFGGAVQSCLLGLTGYFGYPLLVFCLLDGIMMIIGKKIVRGSGIVKAIALTVFLCSLFTIIQLATTDIGQDFYKYVPECYNKGYYGVSSSTAGGALFGMIAWGLGKSLSVYGAYILLSLIALVSLFVVFKDLIFKKPAIDEAVTPGNGENQSETSTDGQPASVNPNRRRLSLGNDNFELKSASDYSAQEARRRSEQIIGSAFGGRSDYGKYAQNNGYQSGNAVGGNAYGSYSQGGYKNSEPGGGQSYGNANDSSYGSYGVNDTGYSAKSDYGTYSEEYGKSRVEDDDFAKTPRRINPDGKIGDYEKAGYGSASDRSKFEDYDDYADEEPIEKSNIYIPENYKEAVKKSDYPTDKYANDESDYQDEDIEKAIESEIMSDANNSATDDEIVDFSEHDNPVRGGNGKSSDRGARDIKPERPAARRPEPIKPASEKPAAPKPQKPEEEQEEINPYDQMPLDFRYNQPPLELFKTYKSVEDYGAIEYFKQEKATTIMNTLKVLGGVNVKIVNIVHGPTITRFDLEIPDDVSIKNIMKYGDDLKLRLKTASEIRFATIPKTPFIGVEVANDTKSMVGLRDVLESEVFVKAKPSSLTFAIGKNIVGDPVVADITKMPHLLIAGSTGTGKSVGLNSLLVSLMYKYSPADLRFIIVDPKQVEFTIFEGIPHMLFNEILCDAPKTVAMLNWAVKEMEDRYTKLKGALVRNIDEYNDQIDPRRERRMPRLVIIVDEFADLMSVEKKNIEDKIARIAQKARAAGIYLILATQRPDVKIIEGSIKTNFTSRMAFKMSNAIDSTTILGEAGAEKLLGAGDLLYKTSTMTNVERAQGAFIGTDEIKNVVKYIKDHNKCYFNDTALKVISKDSAPQVESINGKESGSSDAVPEDYIHALKVAVSLGTVSISLLQRKLSFGYPKAAKIVDWMTDEGYVVASQMGKQKQVTLSMDEFIEKFGDV